MLFDELVSKNIEAIDRIEQAAHAKRSRADMVSDLIAGFCGRPLFVYVHAVWFGVWLFWNSLRFVPGHFHFDPPPFNLLTLIVSLEAIFLSSFILISQNRQQRVYDQRNHLDLQINLLAEQESSHLLSMMKRLMDHFGLPIDRSAEGLDGITDPERVAEQLGRLEEVGDERKADTGNEADAQQESENAKKRKPNLE